MKKVQEGKMKGQTIVHYKCNYCPKLYQGPSTSTCLKHLRSSHPRKCPDILKPLRKPTKMKKPFDEDVFMGILLTWIIKTDQPLSMVDNVYFQRLLNYFREHLSIKSRQTISRRMEELYIGVKGNLIE